MATIKYKEDEQGNKKIIVKTDPATSQQKVSCGCCACGGCGGIEDLFGVTTLNYEATVPNANNQVRSVSGVLGLLNPTSSDCVFESAYNMGFFVQIASTSTPPISSPPVTNIDNECWLSVSIIQFGNLSSVILYGHITLEQPPPELPITIDLAGTFNDYCRSPPCPPPIPVTGTITIS
jgi:hypothetical protein